MINYAQTKIRQKDTVAEARAAAEVFTAGIPKKELETILLTGSVARGDYYPGELGGMIDLTILKKKGSPVTAEALLGPNEDPDIPYHCVFRKDHWFAVLLIEGMDSRGFKLLDEPRKFAFLESSVLWEEEGSPYSRELSAIQTLTAEETSHMADRALREIAYLLSDYKTDRWTRREAYLQLHMNLNKAVDTGIRCLYYRNGRYAAAEDRRLYYSYDLPVKPDGYEELIIELFHQQIDSLEDYQRRERLFRESFLPVIKN
jgi:hypothetical protein